MIFPFALAVTASAQDAEVPVLFPAGGGLDAHGFRLATADSDVRDPFTFSRPGGMEDQDWYAGGLFEYAWRPLVFDLPDAADTVVLADVVAVNLAAGYVPQERVRLEMSLPVFVSSTGVAGPQGASIGDLRLGGLVAFVLPKDADGFGLAGTGALDVPTGEAESWLGEQGVAGQGGLAATWEGDVATLSGTVFGRASPNNRADERPEPVRGEDSFGFAGAVGYLATRTTSVGVETAVSVPLTASGREAVGVPAEVLGTVRHARTNGAHFAAGVGVGLGGGMGASPFRLLVGGGFGTGAPAPTDIDGDGFLDTVDACVPDPETRNGFKDDDGCPDVLPTLTIRAMQDGAERSDARIVAVRPDGTEVAGTGTVSATAMPGDRWTASATVGACLEGTGDLVAPAAEAKLAIPLRKKLGTVVLTLTPTDGKPVGSANVQYVVADPDCAPGETPAGGPVAIHQMGPGTHTVYVTVPGYAAWRGTVDVKPDVITAVNVPLAATMVVVEKDQIKILDKVYFETGLAVIQPRSFPLLSEVANVIVVNEIAKIEVQGHTDDQGPDDFNLKLSQDRADSVRKFLIDAGVSPERLVAAGYGETKFIASNKNEAGRSQNRRVEFRIVEATASAP